jgi:hypothetical protein
MFGDDRGQSVQIGAILLFGILVLGLSTFQVFVVPQENRAVEFNGYVEASGDLAAFSHDVFAAGTHGSEAGQRVKTGVRYPSRALLINPGPPTGTVRTTAAENVSVDGVVAVSGEPETVRGFWNTSVRGARNYSTTSVEFSPGYNELDASPVVVSSVGAYRLGSGGHVALTDQRFLAGNRITLVTLDGDVDTGGTSTSLSAAPTSVATRSVTVTGDGGTDFVVTVPVPGNATLWNRSAAARNVRANPNVLRTHVNGSRVDVTFDGDAQYTLRLARVTVHDSSDSNVETATDPAYLVPLTSNGTTAPAEGTVDVAVEVRDEYNNPVDGVDVEFSTTDGSFDSGSTATTNAEGAAAVAFNISDSADTATVTANVVDDGVSPYNSTTISLIRQGAGSDNNDGAINPAGGNDLVLQSADITTLGSGSDKYDGIAVVFKNFDNGNQKNVTRLKLSFYSAGGQGSTGTAPPESVTFDSADPDEPTVTLNTGGEFENTSYVFAASEERTFDMSFYESQDAAGSRFEPEPGDFFVLTAFVDRDGDGEGDGTVNYFAAPQ